MKTIWVVRHQAEGFLVDHMFTEEPSSEQLEPLHKLMTARHGAKHPKSGKNYFFMVVQKQVFEPGEIPEVKVASSSVSREQRASLAGISVSAEGFVTNPK